MLPSVFLEDHFCGISCLDLTVIGVTNRVCRESREGVTWDNRSLDGFELWTL